MAVPLWALVTLDILQQKLEQLRWLISQGESFVLAKLHQAQKLRRLS